MHNALPPASLCPRSLLKNVMLSNCGACSSIGSTGSAPAASGGSCGLPCLEECRRRGRGRGSGGGSSGSSSAGSGRSGDSSASLKGHHLALLSSELVVHILSFLVPSQRQCITKEALGARPDVLPALLPSDPATWGPPPPPEDV